jgi:hypothetical protein
MTNKSQQEMRGKKNLNVIIKGNQMKLKSLTPIQTCLFMLLMITQFILFQGCGTTDLTETPPVSQYQPDTLMGDWQGKQILSGGEEKELVAQVIAYDSGTYKINLMKKFDTREPLLAELTGHLNSGTVSIRGRGSDGADWEGTISEDLFKGKFSGASDGSFQLEKVTRLSPTLGIKPPEGAFVLFDGKDFKNWIHPKEKTGYINLARHFMEKNCVAYLQNDLWSEQDQSIVLLVGSDDGIKIWLNGEVAHANNKEGGAKPDQEEVILKLKKGYNRLLLKVTNGSGGWGVFARLKDTNGIFEKDLLSAQNEPTTKYLDKKENFLTLWQVVGPYNKENMKPKELFDLPFAPELENKEVNWKTLNIYNIDYAVKWDNKDEAMQVVPGTGSIMTNQHFIDFQMHLEFRSPFMPKSKGQARGNSGVYLQGRYEIQVLDSYGLKGKDNECGGIYKVATPIVNMCAPPTQWQTYDIDFQAARFDQSGKKLENPRLTVKHNGVLIHNYLEVPIPTQGGLDMDMSKPGPIFLQDHRDLVQYRNIWLIEN